MALNKEVFNPVERLTSMAEEALTNLSFGLDIFAWEVRPIMGQQAGASVPSWGIVYWTKGALLNVPIANMSIVSNPLVTKEALDDLIVQGLNLLREQRAEQMNGRSSQ